MAAISLDAVDAFLAEEKRLREELPSWTNARPLTSQATWQIVDSLGIERAQLRFHYSAAGNAQWNIWLVFRGHPIWGIDYVDPSDCKMNPHCAAALGLPARICGPHSHEWPDNREYLSRMPAEWGLPCRRPIPIPIRRLPQGLAWFADRVRLVLLPEQRQFDVPPKSDLFSGP